MRQSTLALISGAILFIILAYSWCGRNPPSQTGRLLTTTTPTPSPSAVSASATPNVVVATPSIATATATAASPTQTPPPEFQKVAEKAAAAIVELTIFDAKGQL